jgi:Flp pilus assembly protein TadD
MGTVRALAGNPASATLHLRTALEIRDTPDARNNLGVVLRMQGDAAEAQRCFEQAAQGFPGYGDALANLAGASACRLTSHPLRRDRWRDDYQPQDVATS